MTAAAAVLPALPQSWGPDRFRQPQQDGNLGLSDTL